MLSIPGGFDRLDEPSDSSVSDQCRPTSLSGQTRPSKGATAETTWWKDFGCDGRRRHVGPTQDSGNVEGMIEGENLPDCSWKSDANWSGTLRKNRRRAGYLSALKLKYWDVFLHDGRGPVGEYIKKNPQLVKNQ